MTLLDLQIKALQIRNNLFGPPYTDEEIILLRTRADVEGWSDWLAAVEANRSRRKRRWLIRYILMGAIFVLNVPQGEDPYEDEDPWELDL